MPMMFGLIERELGARVAALDFLVALGTHTPMNDAQLTRSSGGGGRRPRRRSPHLQSPMGRTPPHSHARDDSRRRDRGDHRRPARSRTCPSRSTGSPSNTTTSSSAGRCFRTRSSGFSGGTKYLFPGIAAPGDHPLHALARRAHHELRGHRHDRHGGARGDRSRRGAARHAAVAAGARRHPPRRGRHVTAAT